MAEKLAGLAEKAKQYQLETGTTAPSLDHLSATRKTTRQTISLVITSGDTFVFHKEAMPKKDSSAPTVYRAAVFGGGIESEEEAKLREDIALQSPTVAADLTDNGKYPPDAWYRLQGKHMLAHGSLLQMTYPLTPETVQAFIRTEVSKRLKMEAGVAADKLGEPVVLAADPVETPVLNRRLGDYTESIASAHGLTVNERGELVGIGILVQERFTMATLRCNAQDFEAMANDAAIVWHADELVAVAERDTADVQAWKNRLQHQADPRALPIRNHSLLLGAAAAAERL